MSKVKGLEEKNVGLNRDVKRTRHELEETRSQAQALKTALDESTSLVHSLRAQERCASMMFCHLNHSHLFSELLLHR